MNAVLDSPVKPGARPYRDAFERGAGRRAGSEPRGLAGSRRRGLARFAEPGFPSRKSESWRYLDLQPLADDPLLPAPAPSGRVLRTAGEHLTGLLLPGKGPRLVIVDGHVAEELSSLDLPKGTWFGPTYSLIAQPDDPIREAVSEAPCYPAPSPTSLGPAVVSCVVIAPVPP